MSSKEDGHPAWRRGETKRQKIRELQAKVRTDLRMANLRDLLDAVAEYIEFQEGE